VERYHRWGESARKCKGKKGVRRGIGRRGEGAGVMNGEREREPFELESMERETNSYNAWALDPHKKEKLSRWGGGN